MKRCSTALASITTGGTSSSRTATPECQHSIPAVRLTPLEKSREVASVQRCAAPLSHEIGCLAVVDDQRPADIRAAIYPGCGIHRPDRRCSMPLKLLNWNAEWAAAKWKAEEMRRRIGQHAADIVCLTETDTARLMLPGMATPSAPRPTGGNPAGRDRRADGRSCGGPGSPGGTRMIWPRSAPARAICVRHNPDRCGRGNDHRRLLVPNPTRGWVHAGTGRCGRTTRSIWLALPDC